jgi:hypothetical protein
MLRIRLIWVDVYSSPWRQPKMLTIPVNQNHQLTHLPVGFALNVGILLEFILHVPDAASVKTFLHKSALMLSNSSKRRIYLLALLKKLTWYHANYHNVKQHKRIIVYCSLNLLACCNCCLTIFCLSEYSSLISSNRSLH